MNTPAPRKYLAFDIEIARSIPEGLEDWKSIRPLGITCAATLTSDGVLRTWYGRNPDDSPSNQMTRQEASVLVDYLKAGAKAGYTLLTWNGLGFDFDILSEESGLCEDCMLLARSHADMMFHVFCAKGFPLGLDKAARGMSVPGKTSGMDGALAPSYWAEGRRQEILEYVAQDVRATMNVALAAEKRRELRWLSSTGKPQILALPHGWLTVQQALLLPQPDTSWMRTPWKRDKFTSWMK